VSSRAARHMCAPCESASCAHLHRAICVWRRRLLHLLSNAARKVCRRRKPLRCPRFATCSSMAREEACCICPVACCMCTLSAAHVCSCFSQRGCGARRNADARRAGLRRLLCIKCKCIERYDIALYARVLRCETCMLCVRLSISVFRIAMHR
jgi:hypothetical protein